MGTTTISASAIWPARLVLFGMLIPAFTEAAQPLVTDDAAVVAPKTGQLEAWARSATDGREDWAQPACNFTGNLELGVGIAHANPDAEKSSSLVQLQAKTVLVSLTEHHWSFGLNAGAGRDTQAPHGSSAFQLYYARALASWYPRTDLEIDLNLGIANTFHLGTFALAGAAVQYTILGDLQLLAEAFRDQPGSSRYQIGARYIVIPNRVETYASYGNRFNGPSSEWSAVFGVRIQTSAFLE